MRDRNVSFFDERGYLSIRRPSLVIEASVAAAEATSPKRRGQPLDGGSASISRSGSFTLQSQAVCGPSAEQSDGLRRRCPMHCVDSSTKGWSLLTTNRCCRNSSTQRSRLGDIARDPLQWSVIQQPRQTRRHFEHGSPTLPVLDGVDRFRGRASMEGAGHQTRFWTVPTDGPRGRLL